MVPDDRYLSKKFFLKMGLLAILFTLPSGVLRAQISQHLFMALPDSLQPQNRHQLKTDEVRKILENTFTIEGWGSREYNETDSLCLLFAPKYSQIGDLTIRRKFLYYVCRYLYHRQNFHSGKSSMRGEGFVYEYPFVNVGTQYCNIYLAMFSNLDSGFIELSKVLIFKSDFQTQKDSYKDAFNTLQQSLIIAKKSEDTKTIVMGYTSLANLFEKLDLPAKSLTYSDSASRLLEIHRSNKPDLSTINYIIRLKQIAFFGLYSKTNLRKYADSIVSLHSIAKRGNDAHFKGRLLAYSYVLVSGVTYFQKDYKETLSYIDSAYYAFPNLRLMNGWEMAMVLKSLSLRKLGKIAQSNEVIQQLNLNDIRRPIIAMLLNELYEEEMKKGNHTKAVIYLRQIKDFQERRHLLDMEGKALEMEQLYKVRDRDLQIVHLKEIENRNRIIVLAVFLLIGLVLVILIIRYRASLARTNNLVNQLNQTAQLEILHLEAVRAEERKMLGQDLHDGLSSSMAAIRHQLELMIMDISDFSIKGNLEKIYALMTKVYETSRTKSHRWFEGAEQMHEQSFTAQIQTLTDSALPDSHYKKEISVDASGLKNISIEARINTLRIIQEALTNIVKHANANHVQILIYEEKSYVVLIVRDNGKGFKYEKTNWSKTGIGMTSIYERSKKMKGKLDVKSDGNGTEIVLTFPF